MNARDDWDGWFEKSFNEYDRERRRLGRFSALMGLGVHLFFGLACFLIALFATWDSNWFSAIGMCISGVLSLATIWSDIKLYNLNRAPLP